MNRKHGACLLAPCRGEKTIVAKKQTNTIAHLMLTDGEIIRPDVKETTCDNDNDAQVPSPKAIENILNFARCCQRVKLQDVEITLYLN